MTKLNVTLDVFFMVFAAVAPIFMVLIKFN